MALEIKENVLLKDLTTLKTGGEARFLFVVNEANDLMDALKFMKDQNLPWRVIGGGSNVLFGDEKWEGGIIKINSTIFKRLEDDDSIYYEVDAGEIWDKFVEKVCEDGVWGLENLSAIPGTVGAAPIQNIGAYGVEVSELISEVVVFDVFSNGFKTLKSHECEFSYRMSIFKKIPGRYIITKVVFKIPKKLKYNISYKDLEIFFGEKEPQTPAEVRNAVIEIRKKKFPDLTLFGTAGSFFKNPIIPSDEASVLQNRYLELPVFEAGEGKKKISAAWILDKVLSLKGYRVGNVGLFEKQPIVLVNFGGATAGEIKNFSQSVKKKFFEATNINLEEEVVIY